MDEKYHCSFSKAPAVQAFIEADPNIAETIKTWTHLEGLMNSAIDRNEVTNNTIETLTSIKADHCITRTWNKHKLRNDAQIQNVFLEQIYHGLQPHITTHNGRYVFNKLDKFRTYESLEVFTYSADNIKFFQPWFPDIIDLRNHGYNPSKLLVTRLQRAILSYESLPD